MIDHLQLTHQTAIEALSNCDQNNDLVFVGTNSLSQVCSLLKSSVETGLINSDHSFSKVFGYNTNFYYVIEQVEKDVVVNYERGIGYVYEQNGNNYLKRLRSFVTGKNSVEAAVNKTNTPFEFRCYNSCNLVIYSSLPPTYIECLAPEHCVLTSSQSFLPQPVVLNTNSFLARINDNIESVSFDDERLIDKITSLISQFTKQLKLKTSKLTTKKAEFETLQLTPSTDTTAKAGTLRYDKQSNKLMLFDGQSWRTVSLEPSDSGE